MPTTTTKTKTQRSAFPEIAPTSERAWLAWSRERAPLDATSMFDRAARVVVVSPHPDDETLACGGLLARLRALDVDVLVVAVTDGEGSHPGVGELAEIRTLEQRRALGRLGVQRAPIRLGLPDAAVAHHAAELRDRLSAMVRPNDVVVAPWSRDGHTDHDACGSAAEAVATAVDCALLEYPVWAWQWAAPSDLAALTWERFAPGRAAVQAKTAALECFPSQTTDRFGAVIVDPVALTRFRRPFEVFTCVR